MKNWIIIIYRVQMNQRLSRSNITKAKIDDLLLIVIESIVDLKVAHWELDPNSISNTNSVSRFTMS
ncbi:hypothetical protein Hanom_Chr14g01262361 [Helianthus anomalus]